MCSLGCTAADGFPSACMMMMSKEGAVKWNLETQTVAEVLPVARAAVPWLPHSSPPQP